VVSARPGRSFTVSDIGCGGGVAIVNFEKPEKDAIIQKIREYCAKELDYEIGKFEAGFLLNFFTDEIGPHFYNQGLHDAQAILRKRMEDITGAIDALEKPTLGRR
jgi:uncharacterized protein (DUF2164 family)